jgi:hypothetical protein
MKKKEKTVINDAVRSKLPGLTDEEIKAAFEPVNTSIVLPKYVHKAAKILAIQNETSMGELLGEVAEKGLLDLVKDMPILMPAVKDYTGNDK